MLFVYLSDDDLFVHSCWRILGVHKNHFFPLKIKLDVLPALLCEKYM